MTLLPLVNMKSNFTIFGNRSRKVHRRAYHVSLTLFFSQTKQHTERKPENQKSSIGFFLKIVATTKGLDALLSDVF